MNIYSQLTGRIYGTYDTLLGVGYAGGDKGNDPEGVNNPAMQGVPNSGPLPCGFYVMGAPYDHPTCGEFFIPLTPNPTNRMFGRGGFGIHGDLIDAPGQHKASDGCIILSRDVREILAASIDHDLKVISGLDSPVDVDGQLSV